MQEWNEKDHPCDRVTKCCCSNLNGRGISYCTSCVEKAFWTNPLIGGMEKGGSLHQLFNPCALAKPAADGKCPQRPKCFWKVQHKYLEAGC